MHKINQRVLMSGAEYFNDTYAINAHMDSHISVDVAKAVAEHDLIVQAFRSAGIEVVQVPAPKTSQDGVYTANWALVVGDAAIMANLPPTRMPERPYAEDVLAGLGYKIKSLSEDVHFSGQGDALPCGDYLFVGTGYRTSQEAHTLLADLTGKQVIGVRTIPSLDENGRPKLNEVSGWPDSLFYDLDLAIGIIRDDLIVWCPEAFDEPSQAKLRALPLNKIEVDFEEAVHASACNLVSTGKTVIMGNKAPKLAAHLRGRGLEVIELDVSELLKGGGFIRCTSLALS